MSAQISYKEFLEEFRNTIVSATARLQEISDAQSTQKNSPEEWSPKEILGHLIDSAANNHQRFVRAQFKDDLIFPGYEQDEWVKSQRYQDESWPEVLQLWNSYNLHLLHVVTAIPEDVLSRPRTRHALNQIAFNLVDQNEPATLEYLIRDYLDHLRHHLGQIFAETQH